MRRPLSASVLIAEGVLIGLFIPVAITVSGSSVAAAFTVGGGLAISCLVLAGLLRYRWAYWAASVLQVLVVSTGFLVPAMFFLGAVFAALWATASWLGRRVEGVEPRYRDPHGRPSRNA